MTTLSLLTSPSVVSFCPLYHLILKQASAARRNRRRGNQEHAAPFAVPVATFSALGAGLMLAQSSPQRSPCPSTSPPVPSICLLRSNVPAFHTIDGLTRRGFDAPESAVSHTCSAAVRHAGAGACTADSPPCKHSVKDLQYRRISHTSHGYG